jgi:hypothetical protein
MDQKPENGCEIQNSACGRSGVMIHLKLVKTAMEAEALGSTEDKSGISSTKAAETYYTACSKIDQHNGHCQNTLMLERKLVTTDWSRCVNLSILAICIVDTWQIYNK